MPLTALLVRTGLAGSRTKARQFIAGGGAYINNERAEGDVHVTRLHLATSRHILLRIGKKNYHVVCLVE